jgi:multidrug efflux pump subunit AcrA (membrane-fusion protein)
MSADAAIRPPLNHFTKSGQYRTLGDQTRRASSLASAAPSDAHRPRKPLKARLLATAIGLAGAIAASAAYHPWNQSAADSEQAANTAAATPRSVTIARPSPAASSSVVLPATFRPWQTAALNARVSGYLAAWHKDLGARVKTGELLAEIETPELDQELAEGRALAAEALAAAAQARAERTEAEADLKMAEAQLVRIQAETELVKSQWNRRKGLVAARAISQEEYDTFLRQTEASLADVAAAESDVVRRRANLKTRAAIIEVRDATANSRQANVARLEELQAFKRIVAPFDGVVMRRTAEVGMLVTAGQETLFVLVDASRIRVQINVPQTYAMQTRPGVPVSINLPESAETDVPGEITRIASSVDAASRTMLAEVELKNESLELQPGSYAQATFELPRSGDAWTIPTNAIAMRVDGPHVAVVDDQQQIELKKISLGRDLGARVVALEGIRGNERLVVNPSDDLVNGLQVQIGGQGAAGQASEFAGQ